MRLPLRTRVSLFVVLSIVSLSLVTTLLFAWLLRETAEREILARGHALGQALARAAAQGLAAEDLDLLDKAAYVVHSEDVHFAQVFSSIWSPIQAYPFDQLHAPPSPDAVQHFKGSATPFVGQDDEHYDFYAPIVLKVPQAPEILIGYARLALTTATLRRSLRRAVLLSLLAAATIAVLFAFTTQALIGRAVVTPLLGLHRAVASFREGRDAEAQAPAAAAEIVDLAREFNAMRHSLRDREERLSEEKERLAVTLRSIGDGVIVTDGDGRVTLLNRVAEELTGWTTAEAAGRPFCQVFVVHHERTHEPCENIVSRVMATGGTVSLANHTALSRRDGRQLLIEDAAAPIRDRESQIIGVVLVFRDVTEKQRMEDELFKAEKLQAVGVLAGGLAHDFNNLLTGMLGNISLAMQGLRPADRALAWLENAEAAARRAGELTAQLLTFSRGGAPVRSAAAIDAVLLEAVRFTLSGTSVAAEFAIAPRVWPVEVDAGQMSLVFSNLALNAVQAMPGGGRIAFAVENVALAAGEVPTLAAGDYVRIIVSDAGQGIAPEHLGRIFDPYFTTRADGTGLGLTSVYSIVKKHDGHITVSSTLGRGTTFQIYLPAAHAALPSPAAAEADLVGGEGPVLVMDDEELVRNVASEILRTLGYAPVVAADGERALELYRLSLERGAPFRAVIMDLTIPGGMGGKEAVGQLLALDPGACVIVSSGYSNDPVMADFRAFGFKGVILKPYNVKNFGRTLHEALAGKV